MREKIKAIIWFLVGLATAVVIVYVLAKLLKAEDEKPGSDPGFAEVQR